MVKGCPTLIPYVYDFLENKAYSKGKGDFARKVTTFFFFFYIYSISQRFGTVCILFSQLFNHRYVWMSLTPLSLIFSFSTIR